MPRNRNGRINRRAKRTLKYFGLSKKQTGQGIRRYGRTFLTNFSRTAGAAAGTAAVAAVA